MTKTNAEILEEYDWKIGHNKHKQPCCNVVIGEIICEGHLNTLMDRARAEERKKLKPKITREQLIQLTLWSYEITIDDENYEKYLKLTEKNIKAMGLEVEK